MTIAIIIALVVLAYLAIMATLMTPTSVYSSTFDRVTGGHYHRDRTSLQIMLDHLRQYPQDWSINRTMVSFPKEGSKQIYLNFDEKAKSWEYTLNNFDSRPRRLDGHFGKEFSEVIARENNARESQALLRNFYPELNDGRLLLK